MRTQGSAKNNTSHASFASKTNSSKRKTSGTGAGIFTKRRQVGMSEAVQDSTEKFATQSEHNLQTEQISTQYDLAEIQRQRPSIQTTTQKVTQNRYDEHTNDSHQDAIDAESQPFAMRDESSSSRANLKMTQQME